MPKVLFPCRFADRFRLKRRMECGMMIRKIQRIFRVGGRRFVNRTSTIMI